jgi:hypothetical protein
MQTLQVGEFFNREDIHSIFSPDSTFTPQAGTWGLQGMVRIPSRQGDWVFFVTFGQIQGEHSFDESITHDGVLSWQSQPSQGLTDKVIQELINHDDRINNIHLFLRSKKGEKYGYFGKLGYLTHDTQREKPVHFQWQLMQWPLSGSFLEKVGIALLGEVAQLPSSTQSVVENELTFVSPPSPKKTRVGTTTSEFRSKKSPNYALIETRNAKLGLMGEELVCQHEIKKLQAAERHDLAAKVLHLSVVEGDGAGYDIHSYATDGRAMLIEVKTTRGPANTDFYLSPNELERSRVHHESYVLYRLYEFDPDTKSAKVFIVEGDIASKLNLRPVSYQASLKEPMGDK